MKVEELANYGIPEDFIQKFKEEKVNELFPPQEEIVKKKLFQERNLVISLPTAGGKTLIAALAMINKLSKSRCKIVYTVPLVALANEKYNYFKKLFEKKWKVAISVGDFDSSDPWLAEYDVIVCTNEKLDSLIRHGSAWIRETGLIVVDEIHLLNDPGRGPTPRDFVDTAHGDCSKSSSPCPLSHHKQRIRPGQVAECDSCHQ